MLVCGSVSVGAFRGEGLSLKKRRGGRLPLEYGRVREHRTHGRPVHLLVSWKPGRPVPFEAEVDAILHGVEARLAEAAETWGDSPAICFFGSQTDLDGYFQAPRREMQPSASRD